MPTLLQINVVSNLLSTGKIAEDIAKVALAHGWKSYVAYGRDSKPSVSQEIKDCPEKRAVLGDNTTKHFQFERRMAA